MTDAERLFDLLAHRFSAQEAALNSAGASLGKPEYGSALRAAFEQARLAKSQGALGARLVEASRVLKTEAEPLLGLLFLELGRACQQGAELTLAALKEGLRNTVTSLVRVGGARFGDGTLLDALLPVSETVHAADSLDTALNRSVRVTQDAAARLPETHPARPSTLTAGLIVEALAESVGPSSAQGL